MPLITPQLIEIELEISDKIVDSTIMKRKAKLFSMVYNMHAKCVVLNWEVTFYSNNSDGSYGENLSAIAPKYTRENIADNTTAVDPTTGAIIPWEDLQPTITIDPVTGDEIVTETPTPYMLQYDWFNQLGENVDINVHNLIRQYGNAITDWDKK